MNRDEFTLATRSCLVYPQNSPRCIIVQPVDEHERAGLPQELAALTTAPAVPFLFTDFVISDWSRELSPWDAPAVFGSDGFGHGAADTLAFIATQLLPAVRQRYELPPDLPVILGGYSLAALFALWCGYETDIFTAVAAASPSVWFPGWLDYARAHQPRAGAVYLSLGDREERTRHPVLRTVADCLREQHRLLQAAPGVTTTLAWNEGNHFRDTAERTAKGLAWCLQALVGETR